MGSSIIIDVQPSDNFVIDNEVIGLKAFGNHWIFTRNTLTFSRVVEYVLEKTRASDSSGEMVLWEFDYTNLLFSEQIAL